MNVIFMGTPDFAVSCLKRLHSSDNNVAAVFTQPDKPKGRGYKLIPPPVKVFAQEQGISVYQPQSLKKDADEYIAKLREIEPDVIVVAAYGKILPKEVLNIPKYGCINVHASLLPEYRGAAPIQRAIYDGKTETGVTIMQMAEGLDTGDMLLKESIAIGENETSSELFERLGEVGAELLVRVLEKLKKGELVPEPQDDAKSSYAAMITKDMCPIDFSQSVFRVHRQISALSEQPGAICFLDGKRLKIYHSEIVSAEKPSARPGEFVGTKNFDVACADGVIRFTELQPEGGKRMFGTAYLNGKPVKQKALLTSEADK